MDENASKSESSPKRVALLIGWRILVVGCILAAGVKVMEKLAAQKKPPAESTLEATVPLVSAEPLIRNRRTATLIGYGSVRSGRVTELAPEVSGRIVWVADLDPGDVVAADAPILRIEARDFHISLAANQARLAATKAELQQLKAQLASADTLLEQRRQRAHLSRVEADRLETLFESKKIGTRSATDAALRAALVDAEAVTATEELLAVLPHRIQAAEATLAQLDAQIELDNLRIARCELRSPAAGRVSRFSAEIGAYAAAASPVATLVDDSDREISVALRADQVTALLPFAEDAASEGGGWFAATKPATATITDPTAPPDDRQQWRGVVDRIADVDPQTRMAAVIVVPKNDASAPPLPPGTFCEVRISGREIDCFAIPRNALRAGNAVFVAVDNKLQIRKIQIRHVEGDTLLIDGDLEDGELLVTSRVNAPLSGMPLRLHATPDDAPEGAQE